MVRTRGGHRNMMNIGRRGRQVSGLALAANQKQNEGMYRK